MRQPASRRPIIPQGVVMPLIGLIKEKNERVNILTVENPRSRFKKGEIVCQLCHEPMFVAEGLIRKPYFSHYTEQCSSDYHSKPESPEHRFFKEYLAKMLFQHISDYSETKPLLEYPVPEIRRIIDVAFEFKNGWLLAHEVQLSSITVEEISERTNDYRKAGIDVHWWLGGAGNSEAVNEWCRREYGGSFILDYRKASEHIALYEILKNSMG